jgi:hypothetical protein
VGLPSFWSVERDDASVTAVCPEPLRYTSEDRPEWMDGCAAAIRDELRSLAVDEGTMLEASVAGEAQPHEDLVSILLTSVGVPEAQVHAGVRLRRHPPPPAGVVQRYRRVPLPAERGEGEEVLASMRVPFTDGLELEAARQAMDAALGDARALPPAGIAVRVHVIEPGRRRGSVALIKKLLDGACTSFAPSAADVTFAGGAEPRIEIELLRLPGA